MDFIDETRGAKRKEKSNDKPSSKDNKSRHQGWTSNERSLRSRRIFAANANRTNANYLSFANKRTRIGPYSPNRTRMEAIRVRLLANEGLFAYAF